MIELAVLIAFAVLFINSTTWQGHVWENVANWLDVRLPEWLSKPLYGCPICMTPHWGLGILYLLYLTGKYEFHVVLTPLLLFAASGINVVNNILCKWYERMNDQEDAENEKIKTDSEFDIQEFYK